MIPQSKMGFPDLTIPDLTEVESEALHQLDGLFVWDFMFRRSLYPLEVAEQGHSYGMAKMLSELELILSQLRNLISTRLERKFKVLTCHSIPFLFQVFDLPRE